MSVNFYEEHIDGVILSYALHEEIIKGADTCNTCKDISVYIEYKPLGAAFIKSVHLNPSLMQHIRHIGTKKTPKVKGLSINSITYGNIPCDRRNVI